MDELFDMILDAVCEFFGIDTSRDHGRGILRKIFKVLLRVLMFVFGAFAVMLSFLQIRKMHRHRWLSVLLLGLLILAIALIAWGIWRRYI